MKTSSILTTVLSLTLFSGALTAMAEDARVAGNRDTSGSRSQWNYRFAGIPLPQQWLGQQPSNQPRGVNWQNRAPRSPAPCPNGQCQAGTCAGGQCAIGNCVGGQCPADRSSNRPSSVKFCPNGNCDISPYTNRGYPPTMMSDGKSQGSGVMPADPFRRSGSVSNASAWTPRQGILPLNAPFNSRHDRNNSDLRTEYLGGELHSSGTLRAPLPSRRSMEAPVEFHSGVARF